VRHKLGSLILAAATALSATSFANLLTNPDFSLWDSPSQPAGWTVEDTLVTKTRVDQEAATVRSAPCSAKLTRLVAGTGSNFGLKQLIPVAVGRAYTVSAWCYDDNVDASGGLSITWCRADSSSLGNTGVAYSDSSIHTWQKLAKSDTAPDSSVYAKVLVRVYGYSGNQPNGFVFFDDAEFDTGMGAIAEGDPTQARLLGDLEIRPNPTTGRSSVLFNLARTGHVELDVYDLAGNSVAEVHSGALEAGRHRLPFAGRSHNGEPLAPGLYFLVLTDDANRNTTRKVVLKP